MPANGNTRLMTWKKSKTMESKITFKIAWDIDPEEKSGYCLRRIKCGDAEDIPVPLYMATLRSMVWGVEQTLKAATMDYMIGPPVGDYCRKDGKKLLNAKGGES